MRRDAAGYVWVGTQDGAARWNGRAFQTFDLPGPSNYVTCLETTPDGTIWLGTESGLFAYRSGAFSSYRAGASGLLDERIRSLFASPSDPQALWIGTDSGLAKFSRGSFTDFANTRAQRVISLLETGTSEESTLFVGTERGTFLLTRDGLVLIGADSPALAGARARCLARTSPNGPHGPKVLWIGTDEGLLRYEDGRLTRPGVEVGLPGAFVQALLVTGEGTDPLGETLWIGTDRGLAVYADGRFSLLTEKGSDLPGDGVWSLLATQDSARRLVWAGIRDVGIARIGLGGWKALDRANSGLPRQGVYAMAETGPPERPVYWFGTEGGGLVRYTKGDTRPSWTTYRSGSSALPSDNVSALSRAAANVDGLWVGAARGLALFTNGALVAIRPEGPGKGAARAGLPSDEILSISPALNGRSVWVGTRRGLVSLSPDGRRVLATYTTLNSALPDDEVYALCETPGVGGGDLWIGTRKAGLARLSAAGRFDTWRRETSALPHNWVNRLLPTSNPPGLLWVATDGGLARLRPNDPGAPWLVLTKDASSESLGSLGSKDKPVRPVLPNAVVYTLEEDPSGRVYASTNRGVVRLDSGPGGSLTLVKFTVRDGLPGPEGNQGGSLADRAGRVFMATTLGVAYIEKERSSAQAGGEVASPFVWESVAIGSAPVDPSRVASASAISGGTPLRLEHADGLSLEYTWLSFGREGEIRYQIELTGDRTSVSNWAPEGRHTIGYLSPGSYLVRVRARDASGAEARPLRLSLRVVPPLWRRSWAFVLYAVAAGLAFEGAQKLRLRSLTRRNALLEERVMRRTEGLLVSEAQALARGKELAETVARLEETQRAAQRAREEAERASRAKTDFLATMSHELRTPLNAVIGMTSLLSEGDVATGQREYVATLRAAGESLLHLINDILDFSKVEAGRLSLEDRPYKLRTAVEEALELCAPAAWEKGLELGYAIAEDVPSALRGDALRLRQVLINLVSNAIKFTPRGEVEVTVDRDTGPFLRFTVRDTGVGVPGDAAESIFEPFTQVDSSTSREYGGTGLGLAICKRLVEAMGGAIRVESGPSGGSRFVFTMPAPEAEGPGPRTHVGGLRKKMLLVTASSLWARTAGGQLRALGIDVMTATSASEAARLISPEGASASSQGGFGPLNAVVLDVRLADLGALSPVLSRRRDLRVLALTAGRTARPVDPAFPKAVAKVLVPSRTAAVDKAVRRALRSELLDREEVPSSSSLRIPLRILLAEDNPINQTVALAMLRRLGYQADVAGSGREALDALSRRIYDAMLLDVRMPEIDGLEVARRVRAELPKNRQPRIVAMTANALPEDRHACLEAGMDDFLAKPVRLEELSAALAKVRLRPVVNTVPPSNADLPIESPKDSRSEADPPASLDPSQLQRLRDLEKAANEVFVDALLAHFFDQATSRLREMEEAGAARDLARLKSVAHALKGTSAQLGAVRLAGLCARLEVDLAAELPEDLAERVREIRAEVQAFQEAVEVVSGAGSER